MREHSQVMTVITEQQAERLKTLKEVADKHHRRQAMIKRRRADDAMEAQEQRKRDEL